MCTVRPTTRIVGEALDFIMGFSVVSGTDGFILRKVGLKENAGGHEPRRVGIGSCLDCQLQHCFLFYMVSHRMF